MRPAGMFQGYLHLQCDECGYEYFKGTDAPTQSVYESDPDYLDDMEFYSSAKDRIQWHHRIASNFIRKTIPPGSACLDVGCFDGFFVRHLCDHGYDARGIDFNRKAIASGVFHFGLEGRISNDTVNDFATAGKAFDIVSLFEVVEHLDEFIPVLRDCVSLLKPRGLLIVSVPNSHMSWRPPLDFPPHHLSRFSPLSLRMMATRLGLQPLVSVEQSNLFDLVRNFTGLLFREKEADSMRGGAFRNRGIVDPLRRIANRSKWTTYRMLYPVDRILHLAGFRYIGQLLIAGKQEQ
ncbi:MAG: class I SAM-dependent methyltransferase [Novosphingobium sp.]